MMRHIILKSKIKTQIKDKDLPEVNLNETSSFV